jgi:hypothetical protein
MGETITSDKSDKYDKWEAENDLRTITEAKKIQADAKRMANVSRAAKEKLSEMAQLKSLAAGK